MAAIHGKISDPQRIQRFADNALFENSMIIWLLQSSHYNHLNFSHYRFKPKTVCIRELLPGKKHDFLVEFVRTLYVDGGLPPPPLIFSYLDRFQQISRDFRSHPSPDTQSQPSPDIQSKLDSQESQGRGTRVS